MPIPGAISPFDVPKYTFSLQKPLVSDRLRLEDLRVTVVIGVAQEGLAIVILNKTEQPIKIDWNQVSYVDQGGKACTRASSTSMRM
jgi:hypothetical protein